MTRKRRLLGYVFLSAGAVATLVFLSPLFPIGVEAFLAGGVFFAAGAWVLAGDRLASFLDRIGKATAASRLREPPRRREPASIDPLLAVRILKLAQSSGGVLTVSRVAIELNVPLEHAEKGLRECVRSGNALEDFDIPRGYTIYTFPEFRE